MVSTLLVKEVSVHGSAQGSEARMKYPDGLAYDSAGNLYFSDQGNHSIRKIDPFWERNNFCRFSGFWILDKVMELHSIIPMGLLFDQAGNLYVVDNFNNLIRKIDPSGLCLNFCRNGDELA